MLVFLFIQAKLPKLSILDLMNCEVTTIDGYKETMFNMLPQLKHLDNADKDGGKEKKAFFRWILN